MKTTSKHFYLFKGDWCDKFIELIGIIQNNQQESFTIWEPQDKRKEYNLIIVSGTTLPDEYCLDKKIWKTDEITFDSFYKPKINQFNIYDNDKSVST